MSTPAERYNREARRLLLAALRDGRWHSGEDLFRQTGITAKWRWAILDELEALGVVESRWRKYRGEPWPRMYRLVKDAIDF